MGKDTNLLASNTNSVIKEAQRDDKTCESITFGTWNIQGLTDVKTVELIRHMAFYAIDILCIQETRKQKSDVYTFDDHDVILSGADGEDREWAGVGFIIAPAARRHVKSFKQVSRRICVLKLRMRSNTIGVVGAYAPHNLRPLQERIDFFNELDKEYRCCRANYFKCVLGDLNSRVGLAKLGEDDVVGSFGWGREAMREVEAPNRELLLEVCWKYPCDREHVHQPTVGK